MKALPRVGGVKLSCDEISHTVLLLCAARRVEDEQADFTGSVYRSLSGAYIATAHRGR